MSALDSGIGPGLGILIAVNNYFHDVATGLMVVGAGAIWYLMTRHRPEDGPHATRFTLAAWGVLSRLTLGAFCYIILAGVPRLYFYDTMEWARMAGDMQVPAIIVKHVGVVVMIGLGLYYWHLFARRIKLMRAELVTEQAAR